MIYTAIDHFYLTDEQLQNSPSMKDGIDEAVETVLRIYGCDLVQESSILLKLYALLCLCNGSTMARFLGFSLRTTLCVCFKSEAVACGVVYAAAHRFQVPLLKNPPWWKASDAEKSEIDEVCRVLAHLYSLPKAQYISVCKDGDFSFSCRSTNSQSQPVTKGAPQASSPATKSLVAKASPVGATVESAGSKGASIKAALEKLEDSKKSGDESRPTGGEAREELVPRSKSEHRAEANGDRGKDRGGEGQR